MSSFKLFKNEIKLFSKSKLVLAMLILNGLISIWGINSINNSNDVFLHNIKHTSLTIALGTARYGALGGALIFSMLVVFILSKDSRKKSMDIIEASLDYYKLVRIRMAALIFYEIIMILMVAVAVWIIQILIFKIPIDFSIYIYCYSIVLFPTILFSILISSGVYMVSDSMDITFLVMVFLFFISMLSQNYLLTWVQTSAMVFSDFGGIRPVGKLIIYNRLLWIFISISLFLMGYLFKRRYRKGLWNSFGINIKNRRVIFILVFTLGMSLVIWSKEPYMKDYPTIRMEELKKEEGIRLSSINSQVDLKPRDESISAHVSYSFDNTGKPSYIKFDTNEGLNIENIKVNNERVNYEKIDKSSLIQVPIPQTKDLDIDIQYRGKMKYDNYMGFAGYISDKSVYLLENSNWIFRPLTEKREAVEISGTIRAPKNLAVVTPGRLTDVIKENDSKEWKYTMDSFNTNIAVFAGEYKKALFQIEDVDVEFYYSPKHEAYIKNKKIEDMIKNMVSFYSEKYGRYYSDKIPLKIVETSTYKPGGHSSANVITFAEYIVNRKANIKDYLFVHDIELIAHEIAHQWWGSAVKCVEDMPWSNEGITNYSAYKYIENEFGESLAYSNLSYWEEAFQRSNKGYYMRNPEKMKKLRENHRRSLQLRKKKGQMYYEMPLKLLKAEELLGEEKFMENISRVYKKYFLRNLTYNDFLREMGLDKEMITLE